MKTADAMILLDRVNEIRKPPRAPRLVTFWIGDGRRWHIERADAHRTVCGLDTSEDGVRQRRKENATLHTCANCVRMKDAESVRVA